ncbi:PREDICTED: protein RNA-directed DNA methylation 3 [Nelumbo nucifera]|uniref:Protein RNA-directed DNA methylation 3 n=2 Tax=Nelumbo nucifera TaxID=4432 RepID=A0A1U7YVB5_NELNU|nr:PREDICTED: protein RNA-directed DNA methylation 3 [Nelumbo nucifera]DAD28582.1 TPA_asm: hypothetical protein HUJ06_030050 [Nelumbo nucifera]
MVGKGKAVLVKDSSAKRKREDNTDKSSLQKRKNPGVLQFFDDAAAVDKDVEESSEDDELDDDDFMDEIDAEIKDKNEQGKAHHLPFLPKEEELSDVELERYLEERYGPGSHYVAHKEDDYEAKRSDYKIDQMPSINDPTIWKVKCTVGRERYSTFCLMQKYADLQNLGTKLQISSAFALDNIKGFIYIEAYKECDVTEACRGLCSIYSTRMIPVPKNELSHLLSARNKLKVLRGMWARLKSGKYKGDLAQVVSVNDKRKRAMIKLIPRIDLQAIAKKLGGGVIIRQTAVPAPRLISSSELEDFRSHIHYRCDRETGEVYEILDGLMLKNGYYYKRVSFDSLSFWRVLPSDDELQKFKTFENQMSDDPEWLSRLYGERRKKCSGKGGKGTSKGSVGTSRSKKGGGFQLHDLVFFGQNDYGVIIDVQETETFQILKHDCGESKIVTVELHEIKIGSNDKKYSALDKQMMKISVRDFIEVLEGPLQGRRGVVRQIYQSTIFVYDKNQKENSGFFCVKAQLCKRIKPSKEALQENIDDGSGPPGFDETMPSPKSPLSPKRPWMAKDNNCDFSRNHQGNGGGIFSVGQALRIRVGPLKGYLCRVIAIYHSDVTVKLDSQLKIITVKSEHLTEVHGKSCGGSITDSDMNPFGDFGSHSFSGDFTEGMGAPMESNGWDSGQKSSERSTWPGFSSAAFSIGSPLARPFDSIDSDPKKDGEGDTWGSKAISATGNQIADCWDKAAGSNGDQNSSWNIGSSQGTGDRGRNTDSWDRSTAKHGFGSSNTNGWEKVEPPSEDGGGDTWGSKAIAATGNQAAGSSGDQTSSWDKVITKQGFGSSRTDNWDKTECPIEGLAGNLRDEGCSWGTGKLNSGCQEDHSNDATGCWNSAKSVSKNDKGHLRTSENTWDKGRHGSENPSWKGEVELQNQPNSWDKGKGIVGKDADAWGNAVESQVQGHTDRANQEDVWGKAADNWTVRDGSIGGKKDSWNTAASGGRNQTGGWGTAGSHAYKESENQDQGSNNWTTWSKNEKGDSCGGSKAFGDEGASWSKDKAFDAEDEASGKKELNDRWNISRRVNADQRYDWNKGSEDNKAWEKKDQDFSLGKANAFDRGQEYGRRGRGGCRGVRDHFNGGRSFSRGQFSGWNKGDQDKCFTGDGSSSRNQSSGWNNDQLDGWNRSKCSGFNEKWNNVTQHSGETNKDDAWNQTKGEGQSANWNRSKCSGFNEKWNDVTQHSGETIKDDAWNQTKGEGQSANWSDVKDTFKSVAMGLESSGQRGRGGRRGGRGNFNRGSFSGRGQSSGWKTDGQQKHRTLDEAFSGNPSAGWNNDTFGNKYCSTVGAQQKDGGGETWEQNTVAETANQAGTDQVPGSWDKSVGYSGDKNSWNSGATEDKGVDIKAGSWGKSGGSWDKGKHLVKNEGAWGKAVESQGHTSNTHQEDSWGKGADSWMGKGGSAENWNTSTSAGWNQTGGWDRESGGRRDLESQGHTSNTHQEDSWGKGADSLKEKGGSAENWNTSTSAGWNQTGGWGRESGGRSAPESQGHTSNTHQEGSWGKGADSWMEKGGSDENWGRESGGRSRGGYRGGRDNFHRGRSFGRGQSSGWNRDNQGQSSGWNRNGQSSGWNRDNQGQSSGWNRDNQGQSSGWSRDNQGQSSGKAGCGNEGEGGWSRGQSSGWGS